MCVLSDAVFWMSSGNNAPPEFSFLEELFPREVYHTTYHTDMSVKDTMVRHSLPFLATSHSADVSVAWFIDRDHWIPFSLPWPPLCVPSNLAIAWQVHMMCVPGTFF